MRVERVETGSGHTVCQIGAEISVVNSDDIRTCATMNNVVTRVEILTVIHSLVPPSSSFLPLFFVPFRCDVCELFRAKMHGYDMTTLLPLDEHKGLLVPKWDSVRSRPVCPFCSGSGMGATVVTIGGVGKRFEALSEDDQRAGNPGALLGQTGVRLALSRIIMLVSVWFIYLHCLLK